MTNTLFTANPYLWICTLVLGLQTHAASPSSFENSFDKSIIESSVLVNLKTIRQEALKGSASSTNRRLSDQYAAIDINPSLEINATVDQRGTNGTSPPLFNDIPDNSNSSFPTLSVSSPISVADDFVTSLTSIYDSMPSDSLVDGVDYAIDYLAANKNLLGLSDASLILAIKSVYSAFIQSAVNSNLDLTDALKDIPFRSLQNIIPERINLWNQDAPKWSKSLAQALVEAISESSYTGDKNALIGTASHSTVTGVLKLIKESTVEADGFYPGIETINTSRTETNDIVMKFDGTLEKFKNFDPAKTRILEFAAKGLADGVFLNNTTLDSQNIKAFSRELGFNATAGAMEYLHSLGDDQSLFAYEISKTIASGLSLGAVYASTSQAAYVTDNLPAIVAEEMSRAVSEGAIKQSLILGNGYSLNRLAETTAFGSSMGAQLASVADKSWDYDDEWASSGRHLLAEATSKGSASGALNAGIGFTASQADVDAGRATTLNEFVKFIENDDTIPDTEFKTTRKELLGIANGSAVGSLLGNTAFAVYYPTLLQPIINYSSQGATSGGILASNLSQVDKLQGVTEQFEIEIARALAHGAAMGAVFQIVGLKDDSMPDKRTFDVETISAVEAVTYGSTFGAITGGIQAGEDAIIIKQAIHQGSKEGASAGVALGLGVSETFADTLTTRSQASINAAVRNANDKAAADANSNMAVKTVQASSRDILQLMRLYNISPKYTNPSGIFSDPNRKAQDKNLFKDPFTVASPI
jgi:hypothetical protein